MTRKRFGVAVLLAAAATAAPLAVPAAGLAASATATPSAVVHSGTWSRVTPLGTPIIEDAGLARGNDGVLHVLWTQGQSPRLKVMDTPVGLLGGVRPAVTVSSGWFIASNPDAVAAGKSLDVFWGGSKTGIGPEGPIESTRPRSGGKWSPSKIAVQDGGAPSTQNLAVTATRPGQPFAVVTHGSVMAVSAVPHAFVRIPPIACCAFTPGVASDDATGATWVGYMSLVKHRTGLFVQRLTPAGHASGPARKLAGTSSANHNSAVSLPQRLALTGRGGQRGGVFTAYGTGYPVPRHVDLLRMGATKARVLASTGGQLGPVTTAADPAGRVRVAWVVISGSHPQLWARRSNATLTAFSKPERIALPAGTTNVWKVYLAPETARLQLVALTSGSNTNRAAYWTRTAPAPR